MLSLAGVGGVLLTFASWILTLWAGWTLVFLCAERAVVHFDTDAPASLWERVHLVGYLISTLGLGSLVAGGTLWAVLSDVASLPGLFW